MDPTSKVSELQQLLEGGADVNKLDETFTTPLGYCMHNIHLNGEGSQGMFNDYKLDLMFKNVSHNSLAVQGKEELTMLLLKHGADPNMTDRQGWSLLHHAAWVGDLQFIQLCIRHGNGDIRTRNCDGYLPVDLAAAKGHTHITGYLDTQSHDLRSMCRAVIRQTLGKRCGKLDKLLLPQRLKLFLNYGIPYSGFSAVLVPPEPWSTAQLFQKEVGPEEVLEFIRANASGEFLSEHAKALEDRGTKEREGPEMEELVSLFQEMYLWEAFKNVQYEEPLARPPRYSMEKCDTKSK